MTVRWFKRVIPGEVKPAAEQTDRHCQKCSQGFDLSIPKRKSVACYKANVQHKGERPGQHEQRCKPLNAILFPAPERGIRRRIPAGCNRCHRMRYGVEHSHAGKPVDNNSQKRQSDIRLNKHFGDLAYARHCLVRPIRRFSTEELHTPDAKRGKDRNRCADDANPAHPLQNGTPQQYARRRLVEARHDRSAGGCDTRHRLKH
ncbi:hypothetical protein D3C73_522670 [compost metagenome]